MNILQYIQDSSDGTARLVKRFLKLIAGNACAALHSNKVVVVFGHDVTLISLTGSRNIEHMSRLSYQREECRVLLNEEGTGIYILNCHPERSQQHHYATYEYQVQLIKIYSDMHVLVAQQTMLNKFGSTLFQL